MTKELLDQLQPFEIFVEKMEKFVEEIKTDEVLKKAGFKLEDMDLRTKNADIFSIPINLEDYFDIWKCILDAADDCYMEQSVAKREICGLDEFFFDLYWNDVEGNSAYYQDMVFWVYFSDEKGICYDLDETNTPY